MILPSIKKCSTCGKVKSFAEYTTARGGMFGKAAACNQCAAARSARWRAETPRPLKPCLRCGGPKEERRPGLQLCRTCQGTPPPLPTERLCSRCKEIKPISEFHARASLCKPCQSAYHKEYLDAVPGRRQERSRRSQATARKRLSDPKERRRLLLKKYQMSPEDYDALLASQGGVCAICGEAESIGENLCVDHDHRCCRQKWKTCGKCTRGLLCRKCNTGVNWDTVPDWPAKAAAYLSTFTTAQ